MKLKLIQDQGFIILQVSEEFAADSVAILQAGIKKMFRDGKNRIALELIDCPTIPADALRQIAQLNLMATELSGQIVFCVTDEDLRKRISGFFSPPALPAFESMEAVREYFSGKQRGLTEVDWLKERLNQIFISPRDATNAQNWAAREASYLKEIEELKKLVETKPGGATGGAAGEPKPAQKT